ncbi:tetratricopeptide repeat protein [Lyngbya sp. PCC 8106]|uniref:tetratricopeptide repeat protein n=1 Tax=Lyngbya sp. (strain PCC 8106) TaxID=313612 RepID=UPI0000EAA962|nr:tetratricopeptide repeat protein [Lyngbya sp. PCC 8106]EAW33937.1 TPR repeat protein [Lyngbya sp. PCC 8106]
MKIELQLQLALSHLEQGKIESSIEICQQVLRLSPRCAVAYRILGNIREVQEQLTEAALAYAKAIELQPDDAVAYAHLAQLYRNAGWIDDAVLLYQTAIKLQTSWIALYYHLGEAFYQQGNFTSSIASYQKVITKNPKFVKAYLGLALVFNSQSQVDQAIKLLKRVINIDSNYTEAYNTLGCLLIEKQQFLDAVEIFQKAINQKPEWAILYNNLGQAWLALEKKGQAIKAYHRALELQPSLTIAYLNLAKLYQQHNHYKRAVDYFQKAIEQTPKNILAYSDCGYSLQKQGQFDQAMVYYQKAIALDPKFVEAYCRRFESMSISETEADEWQLAKNACVRFLRSLQQINFNSGNFNASDQSRESSDNLHLYDHFIQFNVHLGNALTQYGKFDQAARHYQNALQLQPRRVEIYWRLAYCFLQQKQWNLAIAICHLAQARRDKTHQSIAEIDLLLGYIAEKQNRWETAIYYYTKVLQESRTYPTNLIAKLPDLCEEISPQQQPPKQVLQSAVKYISISPTSPASPASPTSSQNCGGLECQPCLKQIFQQLELTNLGQGIYKNSPEKQVPIHNFETFVAMIPNGRVWIVPQENYWMVCKAIAILTPDNQLLADVSREYPGELPGCQGYNPQNHQVFQQQNLPPIKLVKGSVAVLSGLSGHIYFHWMVDVLPRIELLRKSEIKLEEIDWFLVNSYQLPFQRETLNILGIPTEKILESDRDCHLQAEQLIVPSFAGYLGWLHPWAIEFLRDTFLPLTVQKKAENPERIYISRAKARHRQVMNETEVMEVLKPLGFVEVFLESMSFSEQVQLFSQAKVIVAAHGSGLTNIVFCSKEVKVIEFISPHYERYYYRVISQYLGLEHYSLTGVGFVCYPIRSMMYPNPLIEDIWVNISTLKRLIQQMKLKD